MARLDLDPRLRRVAALLLTVLLALLLWAGMAQPLLDLARGDSTLLQQRRLLDDQRRLAARRPQLQREQAALAVAGLDRGDFLSGDSPALAAAELQGRLGTMVQPLGAAIVSVEPLSWPDEQGFRRAGLRLKLSLRQEALAPLLYALEFGKPHLFLPVLSLRSEGKEGLTMTADLFGYLAPEEK